MYETVGDSSVIWTRTDHVTPILRRTETLIITCIRRLFGPSPRLWRMKAYFHRVHRDTTRVGEDSGSQWTRTRSPKVFQFRDEREKRQDKFKKVTFVPHMVFMYVRILHRDRPSWLCQMFSVVELGEKQKKEDCGYDGWTEPGSGRQYPGVPKGPPVSARC